ncbi:MAG: protein-L-isoaspartate O-methyltransferase [Paracoccaceae bacterium]|nr:protein-L-isoaspartate O-methyltransferase [Paracoccaceae bacterium]
MTDYSNRRVMMVDTQVRPSDVTKFPIIAAMLAVARENFVPADKRETAYMSEHIDLGGGRVLMEPRSFAKLLDALDIQPAELILDIGCGFGYSTAVLARLCETVVGVETESLGAGAQRALSEQGVDNAAIMTGELALGAPKHGPYDVIVLQGAVEVIPDAILAQLKEGGRIGAIFMEGALGVARIGYKMGTTITWRFSFNASAPVLLGFGKTLSFAL